jgi:hypothetical protein
VSAALSLAPLAAAGAKPNPHSPTCQAIKREQAGATAAGFAIEKAIASGNFRAAKRDMLRAYDTDLSNVTRALAAIKSAPPEVRTAFKSLRTYVGRIRGDIKNAKSLSQLEVKLQTLGRDPKLQKDGAVIAQWTNTVCGTSVPSAPSGG